jgi:hypothetical protein
VRAKPQIMPRVLIQERSKAVKELLDLLTLHFRTFVPTEGGAGPRRMKYIKELVRAAESPRQQQNTSMLRSSNAYAKSVRPARALAAKHVRVFETLGSVVDKGPDFGAHNSQLPQNTGSDCSRLVTLFSIGSPVCRKEGRRAPHDAPTGRARPRY